MKYPHGWIGADVTIYCRSMHTIPKVEIYYFNDVRNNINHHTIAADILFTGRYFEDAHCILEPYAFSNDLHKLAIREKNHIILV